MLRADEMNGETMAGRSVSRREKWIMAWRMVTSADMPRSKKEKDRETRNRKREEREEEESDACASKKGSRVSKRCK